MTHPHRPLLRQRVARPVLAAAVISLIAVVGCAGPKPPASKVELRSDRALLFDQAPSSTTVDAVVVDVDGLEVPDAVIVWTSSDPSIATIRDDGSVTTTGKLGAALLTGRYRDVDPALVTIVTAGLAPTTRIIETDDVLRVAEDRSEIHLRPTTSVLSIGIGEFVVNGGDPGFLSRVDAVRITDSAIVLTVSDATITDAIEELDLSLKSVPVTIEDELVPDERGALAPKSTFDGVGAATAALQQLVFECKAQTQLVNVGLKGLTISPSLNVSTDVDYRIRNGQVERFAVAFDGELKVRAAIGSVEMRAGITGKVECKANLTTVPFLPVPIVGPIALSATATPNLGVGLEAVYTAAELTFPGVTTGKGARTRLGFEYNAQSGYSLINEHQTIDEDAKIAPLTVSPQSKFTAKVEPFLGVDFGIGLLAGPVLVGRVDMLTAKLFGGAEVGIELPLSPDELAYTGPRWAVYVGIGADMNPLLDEIRLAERLLGVFGLNGLEQGLGVDLTLFELKTDLFDSPKPEVTLSPSSIDEGDAALFDVTAMGADANSEVVVRAFQGSATGSVVARSMINGAGTATASWQTSQGNEGSYTIATHVYDDIFAAVDLPYAAEMKPTLTVRCEGPRCEMVPPDIPPDDGPRPGDCNVIGESYTGAFNDMVRHEYSAGGSLESRRTGQESGYRGEYGWFISGTVRTIRTRTDTQGNVRTTEDTQTVDGRSMINTFMPAWACTEPGRLSPEQSLSFGGPSYNYNAFYERQGSTSTQSTSWALTGCVPVFTMPTAIPADSIGCCESTSGRPICNTDR